MIKLQKKAIRDGIGEALLQLGNQGLKPLVIAADLSGSDRSAWYAKEFSNYFLNVGVSEADAVSLAHGAAYMFKRFCTPTPVFVSTFASMFLMALKRIESICSDNLHVILHGSHGGLVGGDGETHNGTRVLSSMLSLPNLNVIWPADYNQALQLTLAAAKSPGSYFIMSGRSAEPVFTELSNPLEIGKIQKIWLGDRLTLLACGPMVYLAYEVAKQLSTEDIKVNVLNVHTLKPLDEKTIVEACKDVASVITIEEYSIMGGLGSIVSQCLHRHGIATPFKSIALPDSFLQSGSISYLRQQNGLTIESIYQTCRELLL